MHTGYKDLADCQIKTGPFTLDCWSPLVHTSGVKLQLQLYIGLVQIVYPFAFKA